MDHEAVIRKVLAPHVKNEDRRDRIAGEVYAALDEAGAVLDEACAVLDGTVATVEVLDGRVPVETVLAFGLRIEVDTFGNAVRVHSEHGFEVVEYVRREA